MPERTGDRADPSRARHCLAPTPAQAFQPGCSFLGGTGFRARRRHSGFGASATLARRRPVQRGAYNPGPVAQAFQPVQRGAGPARRSSGGGGTPRLQRARRVVRLQPLIHPTYWVPVGGTGFLACATGGAACPPKLRRRRNAPPTTGTTCRAPTTPDPSNLLGSCWWHRLSSLCNAGRGLPAEAPAEAGRPAPTPVTNNP